MDVNQKLKDLLVLDIETVSCTGSYEELDVRLKPLWDKKALFLNDATPKEDLFLEKGGIYAEFGKIITIAVGVFYLDKNSQRCLKVKSFCGENEKELLEEFKSLLEKFHPQKLTLVAHNGKEFDFPYICRRMLINRIELPEVLKIGGKKPWEINHLDTLELWKFGDRKNYTSLELLAAVFDIPTSKDDIDGSMVNKVYYKENNLAKIAHYCRKDVIVTSQLLLRLFNEPLIAEDNIFIQN